MGADCKSAGFAFEGSNPSPATLKLIQINTDLQMGNMRR